ncbi:hypothetical protein [Emticicia sp. 17c]|uniref:hypothetical protein n=1 Tax=Emticicia sp. 17c TaxID=3127704 RepID=UPI00301E3A22
MKKGHAKIRNFKLINIQNVKDNYLTNTLACLNTYLTPEIAYGLHKPTHNPKISANSVIRAVEQKGLY